MGLPSTDTIRSWWQRQHAAIKQRPAAQMLPLGLVVGGGVATLAVLGLGQLPGLLVCALLLGAVLPLLRGAEPVIHRELLPPMSRPTVVPLPEAPPTPMPAPVTMPYVVSDIPGLLEMVALAGGTFLMGSAADDAQAHDNERPQHEVTVSGFAIGRTVATRRLYREVMSEHPQDWQSDTDDDLLPANSLSWYDAVAFCNRLSEQQGLTPCYHIDGTAVRWQREAEGYRLPTEAEWEYAARAGTTTRWFCGDDATELERYAWFDEDPSGRPHPVGQKAPNPWELYDMAGNVWEWCWDGYAAYAPEAVVDPSGDDTSALRVLRGGGRTGSWPGTCGPRAGPGPSPRSGTTASGSAWCVVPAASLESLIFFEHLALIFLVITDSVAGLIAGGKLPLMTRCLGYSTTESISTIARPPWLR